MNRDRKDWSEAPKWATVLLRHGDNYVFAESHKDGAKAFPCITGRGHFTLIEHSWKVVEYRPVHKEEGAVGILNEAAECIGDRAAERDTEQERSMAAAVRAFNGMYEAELTEQQGWQFMVLLKMARSKGGDYRRDDFVDGAAYFALAGECNG